MLQIPDRNTEVNGILTTVKSRKKKSVSILVEKKIGKEHEIFVRDAKLAAVNHIAGH
jgi:hypothetical protein